MPGDFPVPIHASARRKHDGQPVFRLPLGRQDITLHAPLPISGDIAVNDYDGHRIFCVTSNGFRTYPSEWPSTSTTIEGDFRAGFALGRDQEPEPNGPPGVNLVCRCPRLRAIGFRQKRAFLSTSGIQSKLSIGISTGSGFIHNSKGTARATIECGFR